VKSALLLTAALTLVGCAAAQPVPAPLAPPPPANADPIAVVETKAAEPTSGMQWLYGSGEGAAASIQTYRAFQSFVAVAVKKRPRDSVVIAKGSTLAAQQFVPCENKPFAVVLDADETAIQNQGLEYALARRGVASDRGVMAAWQSAPQTASPAMPGAVDALNAIRAMGVTVIFNTNRDNVHAAATAQSLNAAGVGPAEHLKTMFLRGDIDGQSSKDGRRWHVAERYCVIALAGDQLGDFWEPLNERSLAPLTRRTATATGNVGALWGRGWFLLSNPVYGPGLRGSIDEVFAPDMRWEPAPEPENK
jgi:predicted secreted acid phosphatase